MPHHRKTFPIIHDSLPCADDACRTVTVQITVSRWHYLFACDWARVHGEVGRSNTPTGALERFLARALTSAAFRLDWSLPPHPAITGFDGHAIPPGAMAWLEDAPDDMPDDDAPNIDDADDDDIPF